MVLLQINDSHSYFFDQATSSENIELSELQQKYASYRDLLFVLHFLHTVASPVRILFVLRFDKLTKNRCYNN